jgi:hypothetical protein
MTLVPLGDTDDPYFIQVINAACTSIVESSLPDEVWVIQIDNWFDHKWLHFSGIGVVHFPLPALGIGELGALDGFHQERLTFPPFSPNRVLGQWSYARAGNGYSESALKSLPHSSSRHPSETNLHRRVQDFSSSAVFIWYSTNTVANGRGSLMVYTSLSGTVGAWFAAFTRNSKWELKATKGISREDVQQILTHGGDKR